MTPLSIAHTELRLSVARIEALRAQRDLAWDDMYSSAMAELWACLDRIEPGLGLRLMRALYPEYDFALVEPAAPPPESLDDRDPQAFGAGA